MNRSLKELLELMVVSIEKNADINLSYGLCRVKSDLVLYNLINYEEWEILGLFIDTNRPKWFNFRHYDHSRRESVSSYYWKRGDMKPRIKWLKWQIRKCK